MEERHSERTSYEIKPNLAIISPERANQLLAHVCQLKDCVALCLLNKWQMKDPTLSSILWRHLIHHLTYHSILLESLVEILLCPTPSLGPHCLLLSCHDLDDAEYDFMTGNCFRSRIQPFNMWRKTLNYSIQSYKTLEQKPTKDEPSSWDHIGFVFDNNSYSDWILTLKSYQTDN